MKIVNGEKVYIQESDARVVLNTMPIESVPQAIVSIVNRDRDEFVELEEEGKSFINSLDYIMDYSLLSYLSLTDTLALNEKALIELNRAYRLYNEALGLEDEKSIQIAKARLELMKYKEECLKTMIQSKRGSISFSSQMLEPKRKIRGFSFKSKKGRE